MAVGSHRYFGQGDVDVDEPSPFGPVVVVDAGASTASSKVVAVVDFVDAGAGAEMLLALKIQWHSTL